MPVNSFRGRSLIAVVAILGASSAFAAWSASGTVKSTTGTALSGVAVTVLDSSANLKATTDASGNFTIGSSTGILEPPTRAFAAQVIGNELVVSSPKDGAIELALVDASGRSLWTSTPMATQGTAHASLPTGIGHGAVFLRLRSADAVQYQAVIMGPAGIRLATPSARSLATYPVLSFHITGYDDTTYAMTAASQTGIMVVMAAPVTTTCAFPTTFKWKDYGSAIASPGNGLVSIKDFTNVTMSNGQHLIYSSDHNSSAYGSEGWAPFTNWSDAATAKQTMMTTSTVAPELMYFTPKSEWILSYQWGSAKFNYMTSSDPTNANGWKTGGALLSQDITGATYGPIDHVPICDATNCYLFYAADNGKIYRASMPIGSYPGVFTNSAQILSDTQANLFEAVEVYTVKGTGKYLMIVECEGGSRYFRAFSATSLGGTFTAISNATGEATPFAGKNNISPALTWTSDVSHGDMVRGYDETRTIDPCNLQLLYQGHGSSSASYDLLPYKLGLLTFTGK
jgi:hypothetical protein